MEDQDPPIDAHLRGKALERALTLHAMWSKNGDVNNSAELQIEDILYVANRLYVYLKGDTK